MPKEEEPTLQPLPRLDPRWHERIELAKNARELGRKIRRRQVRGTGHPPPGRTPPPSAGALMGNPLVADEAPSLPRSPYFEALNAQRYERQLLIRRYQEEQGCRLVVLIDVLSSQSVTLFEETLYVADPSEDLHLMLATPGGDGETAIRLARQAQVRCRELTVIVPDQAKSAGTLLALGAHRILMGPTSDLGPIDPQFLLADGSLAAGKAIVAAVDAAEERINQNPDTLPLHAALLSDLSGLLVQQARDAIARAGDQLQEALASQPNRTSKQVRKMTEVLRADDRSVPKS